MAAVVAPSRVTARYPLVLGSELVGGGQVGGSGAPAASAPTRSVGAGRATLLALFVIAFNIAVTLVTLELADSGVFPADTALSIAIVLGLVFYALVGWLAVKALGGNALIWLSGPSTRAIGLGVLRGGIMAGAVLGAQHSVTGHVLGDASAAAMISDGGIVRVVTAFIVMALAAPLVEEVVFRGILYRGLSAWRPKLALGISAGLFSIAHLRPAQLWYYFVAGLVLGRVYRRYGLSSSIATHAVFNGALVAATVIASMGSATTLDLAGATVRVPAVWHQVAPPPGAATGTEALAGPGGSGLIVESHSVPPGLSWSAAQAASQIRTGDPFILPGSTVSSVQVDHLPAGQALMINFTGRPSGGTALEIAKGGQFWALILADEGSSRASSDFAAMTETMVLPGAAAA